MSIFLQSVVPDLSYTVRSPMLDTWEGIKQLKAALWALVSISVHLSCSSLIVTKRWIWLLMLLLLLFFFLSGQHWLFKLGSESPAGGERHSWHPRVGSALRGAVSTRVSSSSGLPKSTQILFRFRFLVPFCTGTMLTVNAGFSVKGPVIQIYSQNMSEMEYNIHKDVFISV